MTKTYHHRAHRFALGSVYVTRRVSEELANEEIQAVLERHASGDWGLVDDEDREANEQALVNGLRLLSSYVTASGLKLWVITEADRSATTILFPSEY